jgi:cell division protein FtsL
MTAARTASDRRLSTEARPGGRGRRPTADPRATADRRRATEHPSGPERRAVGSRRVSESRGAARGDTERRANGPGRPRQRSKEPSAAEVLARSTSGGLAARAAAARARVAQPDQLARAVRAVPEEDRSSRGSHLRLVEDRRRAARARRRNTRLSLGVGIAGVIAVMFGLVYLHVVSAQRQFTLDRLTAKATQAAATYENLRLEVDERDTPANILAEAAKLGMVQASGVTVVTVPSAGRSHPASALSTAAAKTASSRRPTPAPLAPAGVSDWTHIKGILAGLP